MQPQRLIVGRSEDRVPLLDFLARHLHLSRKAAKRLLDSRSVFVNRRRVWMARHVLRSGDEVEAAAPPPERRTQDRIPLLFEDEHLAVASKPSGLLSNGPASVEAVLRTQTGIRSLAAVHRLDRDTTGCLLLAKTPAAAGALIGLFTAHRVRKTYHAIVFGRLARPEQEIRAPVDGLSAVTRVRVLSSSETASHVSAAIETGRTHQIRKHLALIRHPVLGDKVYATGAIEAALLRAPPRQMLHAASIAFPHPVTGRPVSVKAPLPGDFRACLRTLRLT